ncbi:MAG: hypothetical protein IJ002_01105 [Clostridia bacterium]|nr:hypothetical protein [Clostridia bacterium]
MKKLIIIALCAVFLFGCGKNEVAETDATQTSAPDTAVTTAETTAQIGGFIIDGIEFDTYPCEDFEPLFVHTVFPSMGNYMVFGLVEDKPKEIFAYYINSVDKCFERVVCPIPEDIEYDRVIPVYAGHGAGSGEIQFAVVLENGNEKIYIAYNNFTYTDYSDYLVFTCEGIITPETHDYIFKEINR